MAIEYRFLSSEEFYLLEPFWDTQPHVPRLHPQFAKVAAAFDGDRVVGFIALQLVAHAEPIMILPEYQQKGVWKPLCKMLDTFAAMSGLMGLYTQPKDEKTEAMARMMGCFPCERSLWAKIYYSEVSSVFELKEEDKDGAQNRITDDLEANQEVTKCQHS